MSYSSLILNDSPDAYWRLGETSGTNANDETSNNRDGTYTGGYTLDQPSLLRSTDNPATLFNGSTGYVTTASWGLSSADSTLTIEAWIKCGALGTNQTIFTDAAQAVGAGFIWLFRSSDGLVFQYATGATVEQLSTADYYTGLDGAPIHVVVVVDYSNKTILFYRNGTAHSIQTTSDTMLFPSANRVKYIGSYAGSDFLSGTVDEVAIYTTALSAATIMEHYVAGINSVNQTLTNSRADLFRRFSVKRRLDDSSGDYEESWQDLSEHVKSWGSVSWSLDETQYSFFQQAGVSMVLKNDAGLFDHEINPASFWNGYLTRYKTLCRIECGFLDHDTLVEVPPSGMTDPASTSTQFIGVLTEPVRLSGDNEAVFNIKSLTSVLEEVPASRLVVASGGAAGAGQLTASDLIGRMRDATDGSSNFIFRPFITSTAWSIQATTQTLTALDTSTALDGYSCWSAAQKLAEATNKAVAITKLGGLYFGDKTATAAVVFIFSGAPFHNSTYGHTIKRVSNAEEDFNFLFNRVRIKFKTEETSTSYKTKEETFTVGDSSTSWKYGIRTLEFENTWMPSATADAIASTLAVELNAIKARADLACKYIPTLNLLDRAKIDYDPVPEGGTYWDEGNWDESVWPPENSPIYFIRDREYKIIAMWHDLDLLETNVTLRQA